MATKMPRAVVDLDDFVESNNIMVYGDTGTGKTEIIGQLPGKVLILSSENGTTVIKRMMKRLGWPATEFKRFKIWPIRKWNDLEEAYNWCEANPGVFDWIAIDSATSVQQRSMRAAMLAAVTRNPEKRDIDLPDRGEHQKMQNSMKRMIQDFNELPVNVLWLAQAMRREDRDGNEIVVPFIMGKDYEVSAWACAQMQAFGCYIKRPHKAGDKTVTKRVLLWDSFADGNSGVNYWAKDRYQVFPRAVTMAVGDEQKVVFSDLLALIDADGKARADRAVETRDDPEPDDDDAGSDDTEPDTIEPVEPDAGDGDADTDDWREGRRAELEALTKKDLATAATDVGLDLKSLKGKPVSDVIEAILDAEQEEAEREAAGDPDTEPDADDAADDPFSEEGSGDDDGEEQKATRRAELMEATPAVLKKAATDAGLNLAELKGKSREEGVEIILRAEFNDQGDDALDLEGMAAEPSNSSDANKNTNKSRFRAADED